MPKITVTRSDLVHLSGLEANYPLERLEEDMALVKGELKRGRETGSADQETLRIELADTNRPDLWCVEGVARQIRDYRRGCGQEYAFYTREPAARRMTVDVRLQAVRPFIGGFVAVGGIVDETGLLAFIEGQETLDRNFGRRRKAVSIGLYDGRRLQFPVRYRAVGREEVRFVALAPAGSMKDAAGWSSDTAMTPREILERHPTGQEYAWTLEGSTLVPLLEDAAGQVLSLIPIINSAGLGRVMPGVDSLFVEASGTDLDQVLLTLNILAANLSDRGWDIQPVTTEYPYETPRGRVVTAPHEMTITQTAPLELFRRLFGEHLEQEDILQRLTAYGVKAAFNEQSIVAAIPSYRQDYLHPVDVTEDYAISRGYGTFQPAVLNDFTVGRLHRMTEREDLLRDLMIGLGFEEAICNILTSGELLRHRMQVGDTPKQAVPPFHGGPNVRIQNVMNLNYAELRDWILPSLLEIESHSEGALYPHRIFEVGEVAVFDRAENMGSRTESRLGAVVVEENASFDSVQSVAYALLNALHLPFRVIPWEHPSFVPGRVGLVIAGEGVGKAEPLAWLGFLGELSPQVLTNWVTRMPASALEISVNALEHLITKTAESLQDEKGL